MMSIFLVLRRCSGRRRVHPRSLAGHHAMMHELGVLTLTTTDQYYIFNWWRSSSSACGTDRAALAVPRWFGYFSAWIGMMFEAGAMAFNFAPGRSPGTVCWSSGRRCPLRALDRRDAYLLLKSLKLQRQDALAAEENAAVLV